MLISFRHWSHSLNSGSLFLVMLRQMTGKLSHWYMMHQTNTVITITNTLILEFSWHASLNWVNYVKYSSTDGWSTSTYSLWRWLGFLLAGPSVPQQWNNVWLQYWNIWPEPHIRIGRYVPPSPKMVPLPSAKHDLMGTTCAVSCSMWVLVLCPLNNNSFPALHRLQSLITANCKKMLHSEHWLWCKVCRWLSLITWSIVSTLSIKSIWSSKPSS